RDLLKAASTMGARRGQAFFRIYLPLSLPGVTAAALLTFITSLGFFITPALLGSPRESMIAQIILTQIQELLNWRLAGALSLVLLACALGIFAVYDRVANPRERARDPGAPVSALRRLRSALGRRLAAIPGWACDRVAEGWERLFPPRADRPPADRGGMALRVVAGTLIVFLVAPAFVVVPVSFTAGNFIALPPDGLSLRWYETYLGSRVWMNATGLSFLVGVVAALLTTLLGTAAAFVLTRQAFPGRRVVMALFISPLIVPRIVTAVALFYLFARLELVGTVTGLVIGHTVLALPFVVVTVMAILKSYDIRYDQAAATLGAGPLRTLRHVTLPLLKAGIVSAFLFAFVTSFDELTVALFISAGTVTTLPKAMWSDLILQMNPTLAAVSTVILVMATAIVLAAEAFQRRASRHRGASS
ncbi:MAG: ABC transporter permease subunit, partial [Alphaproteobacteria bacterium]